MNRLRAARHLVTHYTPFKFWIGPIWVTTDVFSRLDLMPHLEMMNPSSMPLRTLKTHFFGLSLMPLS
jgi:hypothetical protein